MIHRLQFSSEAEWLQHRDRIGGSECSAIIGMNPYMTNIELWQIKTGRIQPEDISDKPYVRYGHQAEPLLRELFKLDFPEYRVEYYPNNMILNDGMPWAHASLDGELVDQDGRRGILEIKTTNILQSMQKEKWNDGIPDNYYCQILHYLMVTGYSFVILKAQLKSEWQGEILLATKHYKIERKDVEDDINYLRRMERDFWDCVKRDRRPDLILPEI